VLIYYPDQIPLSAQYISFWYFSSQSLMASPSNAHYFLAAPASFCRMLIPALTSRRKLSLNRPDAGFTDESPPTKPAELAKLVLRVIGSCGSCGSCGSWLEAVDAIVVKEDDREIGSVFVGAITTGMALRMYEFSARLVVVAVRCWKTSISTCNSGFFRPCKRSRVRC